MGTVLIVDDEPANIDLLRSLMPAGVRVKAALKGEVALKLIAKQPPELVLLDLVMPGIGGFETLKQIKAMPEGADIAVVIVSANGCDEDIRQGKALGAVAHLTKPVDAQSVALVAEQFLSWNK